jgi:ubiquinone/menaquinone biosynthesis C-methylase UbiE
MAGKAHWEDVYTQKRPDEVSWFLETATQSLDLINAIAPQPSDAIIDVGGGASRLVDALLAAGFSDLSILDLSAAALKAAQDRLGDKASRVQWIEADITQIELAPARYDIWHDRAVFHFMTTKEQRAAYKRNLTNALRPSGHVIIATFAENGPEKCSGLPVQRYSVEALSAELGPDFTLIKSCREAHRTPWGSVQEFIYCLFKRS